MPWSGLTCGRSFRAFLPGSCLCTLAPRERETDRISCRTRHQREEGITWERKIQLTGQGFDKFKWRRELGNVVYAEAAGPLAPISVSPLTPETADLVLFDDDGDREASPDAELWLLPMGGIRGVTVKNSPDGIILSMPVCSGGSDWTLCQALAQTGIECGGEVQVDGQAIPREQALDLTPQANASWQESMETIQQLSAQGHEITLPIVLNQLHLEISPEQLASPTLGDDLVGRMQRIAEAHLASTMVVETQEGQTLHLNVAGGVPTLVAREAQGIVLYDAQDDAAMPGEPLLGGSPVPMERFLDLMGDRVESAGPMIYVPATTFTSDPELMGSLEAAAREANFESAPQAMSSGLDRDLARGPVLVFLLVAAADGVVDEKEVAAFQALLINSERAQGRPVPTNAERRPAILSRDLPGDNDSRHSTTAALCAVPAGPGCLSPGRGASRTPGALCPGSRHRQCLRRRPPRDGIKNQQGGKGRPHHAADHARRQSG